MLMKSAAGHNENCCNTSEDREIAQYISDTKMQVKRKKDPVCIKQRSTAL